MSRAEITLAALSIAIVSFVATRRVKALTQDVGLRIAQPVVNTTNSISERQLRTSVWLNVITAAGTLVAFFGIFAVYQGLVDGRKTTIENNRSWLYPKDFNISIKTAPLPLGGFVERMDVNGNTENVGRDPASDVLFASTPSYGFLPIKSIDPKDFNIPRIDMCSDTLKSMKKTPPSYQSTIFPGQKLSYERGALFTQINPTQDWNLFLSGGAVYYWQDCVVYKTFDELHRSAFCFFYSYDVIDQKLETFHCPYDNEAN